MEKYKKILGGKSQLSKTLGRPRCKWENNSNMYLRDANHQERLW
jgi:hypothetical protein